MQSRNFSTSLATALVVLSFGAPACRAQDSPNIILMYVDDLRFDGLGITGHGFAETPNLDTRVGGVGTVFNNSFVTTPVCSPARASVVSGQYVRTHGLIVNEQTNFVEDSMVPNYHALLRDAGYRTGHIGKWHRDEHRSARPGYDYWAAFTGQGNHQGGTLNIEADGAAPQTVSYSGWTKDTLTDYAIDFLDDYGSGGSRTEPFALTLSFKSVHSPFGDGETASGGLYANEPVAEPVSRTPEYGGFNVHTEKPIFDRPGFSGPNPTLDKGVTQQRSQIEMMKDIDFQIGRVLDTLEAQGLDDNTIVAFTSDNGFFWGEHGRGDKRAVYEESIRVPLLIHDPRQTAGVTASDAMALNIDIAPTFLDAAGVAIPDWIQGQSLMPVLSGQSTETRTAFAAEYTQELISPNVPSWEAYRTQQHLYVRYPEEGSQYDELYDMQADPYQLNNLLVGQTPTAATLTLRDQLIAQLDTELETLDATNGFQRELYTSHTSDFGLDEQGTVIDTQDHVYVGARSGTGGSNLVLSFEVPVLEVNETLQKAYVSFEIMGVQGAAGPTENVDLWAIGISDGERLEEFLEADTETASADRADNVKLQENVINSESHLSRNFSSDEAADLLADYLNDFYEANPEYAGGKFLQVRLNPDSDFGDVNRSWTVANGDVWNTNQNRPLYKRQPSLSLQVIPEFLLGDLDDDGFITQDDFDLFVANWKADTTGLTDDLKAKMGDLNGDGITDFSDWYLMRGILNDAGVANAALFSQVPEPATAGIAAVVLALGMLSRHKRRTSGARHAARHPRKR